MQYASTVALFAATLGAGAAGCGSDVRLGDIESGSSGGDTSAGTTTSTGSPSETGSGSSEADASSEDGTTGEPIPSACETDAPAAVLFVNFDGAELVFGGENAPNNETGYEDFIGPYPPYGEGEKRIEVMDAVREIFARYNIAVLDERPTGTYAMAMVGPHPALLPGMNTALNVDCGDQFPTNISFVHASVDDPSTAYQTGALIASSLSQGLGLDLTTGDPEEITNENIGLFATFQDACIDLANDAGYCSSHAALCSDGMQNSHAELLDRYGPCPR